MGTIVGISGILIGYPIAVWLLETFTYEIYFVPVFFPTGSLVMILSVIFLVSLLLFILDEIAQYEFRKFSSSIER